MKYIYRRYEKRVRIIYVMEKCCFKFETGYFRKCKLNVPRLFLVLLPGWKIYRSSIYIASVVQRDKK